MTPDELRNSKEMPTGISEALQGLWHMGRGDWDKAHKIVQDDEGRAAAWVHAHLHRVEGDESNAGYWYARAGKPHAKNTHAEEWNEIAGVLLAGHGLL